MNRTINSLLLLVTLLCGTTTLFSQAADVFAKKQLVLRFDPNTTPLVQQEVLDRYHLIVVDGPTPVSEFLLCEIDNQGFPPLPPGGYNNSVDSINGVIVTMDDTETDIDGVGNQYHGGFPVLRDGRLNIHSLPPLLKECDMGLTVDIPAMGPREVIVGVNDSGISGITSGSSFFLDHSSLFEHYMNGEIGVDFVGENPMLFPQDGNGHGTHMTSIMVNDLGGLNSTSFGLELDIYSYRTHDDDGVGKTFDIIEAIDQAVLDKVEIFNLSFSYSASFEHRDSKAPLRLALEDAVAAQNMLIVCAAGNKAFDNDDPNGYAAYPASFDIPNIISVASIACDLSKSKFSSYGATSVDLAAYGEDIPGAWLNGEYFSLTGTSPGAATVSRVANMLAAHQTVFDYAPIKCALINGATYNQELAGLMVANGHLDAVGAYNYFINNPTCENSNGGGEVKRRRAAPAMEQNNSMDLSAWSGVNEVVLNFNAQFGQTAEISIFNLLGQLVYTDQMSSAEGQNQYVWEAATDGSSEMYIVQLTIDGAKETVKVIR